MAHRKWSRIELITDQDKWWVTNDNRLVNVQKLPLRDYDHALNLLFYWRVNARRLRMLALFRFRGPYEEFEDDFASTDMEWIERQPLYAALDSALNN